jgi:hypothetical protein
MSVTVDFTPRVYFSPELSDEKYIVTNDFWFVINDDGINSDGGLKYPTVYIEGLEVLYIDPETEQKDYDGFVKRFLKLFTADDENWHALADESVSPPRLKLLYETKEGDNAPKPSYPVRFTLSAKAEFPRVLDRKKSVDIKIKIEGDSPAEFTKPLSLMFAPYVCQFGAYVSGKTEPVTALYHGEKCNIAWSVSGDTKADVLVRIGDIFTNSQNSCELTVLKDTYCSFLLQSESVNMEYGFMMHRTLMKDTEKTSAGLPPPDKKCSNSKIFLGADYNYYAFIYPSLYMSEDAKNWSVKATDTNPNFNSYAVSFSDSRLAICYISSGNIVTSSLDLDELSAGFTHKTISDSSGYISAFLILSDSNKPKIIAYGLDGAEFSDLRNGTEMINSEYIFWDKNFTPKSADIHIKGKEILMAVLGENGRIYYYNLYDETKNDIFTDFAESPSRVTLITAGKHYIVSDTAVICAENGEKSDYHVSLGTDFLPAEKDIYNFSVLAYNENQYKILQYGL